MSYHGLTIEKIVNMAEKGNPAAIAAVAGLVENHSHFVGLDGNTVLMLRLVQAVFHIQVRLKAA